MALSSTVVWEVRTTGSDTACGGGFNSAAAGTDYSQQDAAQDSGTNLTVHATTNTDVLPDNHTPEAADVGNLIYIPTATGGWTAGRYEIKSIQSGYWRLDRSPAATTTASGEWYLGGANASLGAVGSATVSGHIIYIKNGTYTVTTASTNVPTGCYSSSANVRIIGYSSTRTLTNTGTKPIIILASGVSSATLLTFGTRHIISNVTLNGNAQTSSRGVSGASSTVYNCNLLNFTNGASDSSVALCYVSGCSAVSPLSGLCVYCVATDNTVTPFTGSQAFCVAYDNTGASTDGFSFGASSFQLNCIAYNNGRDGFVITNQGGACCANCIAVSNARYGYNFAASNSPTKVLLNNASYNNTSGNSIASDWLNMGAVTLTGDPFIDAANDDFRLNDIAGRGRALKAAGFPSTMPGLTNSNTFPDIGALIANTMKFPGMSGGFNG